MVVISSRKRGGLRQDRQRHQSRARARGGEADLPPTFPPKRIFERLVDETNSAFGRIDILVCNAASNPYYGPMAGIADEQFRKISRTTCSPTIG